jgi:hypothetical protein
MSGLTYTTYVQQVALMAGVGSVINGTFTLTDPNFNSIIPTMIDYAELRMQREIDFLNTSNQATFTCAVNNQNLNLAGSGSTYPFVTVQNVGIQDPTTGFVLQCTPVTKEYLYAVFPIGSTSALPTTFAMFNDNLILLGPIPDQNYIAYVTGTQRFPSLSPTNPTTFISTYLPDVLVMASMIYLSAYQRNFGRMSDDPQMAQSYESQYQTLMKGAGMDEARKAFEAGGWTSNMPAAAATPNR